MIERIRKLIDTRDSFGYYNLATLHVAEGKTAEAIDLSEEHPEVVARLRAAYEKFIQSLETAE